LGVKIYLKNNHKNLQESKPKNIPQIKESNHKVLGWIQCTTLIL